MPQVNATERTDVLVQVFDPNAGDSASPRLPGPAERPRLKPLRKVLIVEPEPLLRIVLSDALEFAGIETIAANDSAEAKAVLEGHDDIGVILADVSGSGLIDDLDLAWRVAVDHPDVQMVIISALLEPDTVQIPRDALFLRKPFTPDVIIRIVAPLLAEATPRAATA